MGVTPDATLDCAWSLSPQVAVRPEPFGALLYHFGTRQLSFLKDRRLLALVQELGTSGSARAACSAAGIANSELAKYATAIRRLADTDMLRERLS